IRSHHDMPLARVLSLTRAGDSSTLPAPNRLIRARSRALRVTAMASNRRTLGSTLAVGSTVLTVLCCRAIAPRMRAFLNLLLGHDAFPLTSIRKTAYAPVQAKAIVATVAHAFLSMATKKR